MAVLQAASPVPPGTGCYGRPAEDGSVSCIQCRNGTHNSSECRGRMSSHPSSPPHPPACFSPGGHTSKFWRKARGSGLLSPNLGHCPSVGTHRAPYLSPHVPQSGLGQGQLCLHGHLPFSFPTHNCIWAASLAPRGSSSTDRCAPHSRRPRCTVPCEQEHRDAWAAECR